MKKQIIDYVNHCLDINGFAPNFQEIGNEFGITRQAARKRIINMGADLGHVAEYRRYFVKS